MSWNTILFDLDGTVTDPKEGITKSVAFALRHFGIFAEDPETLTKFIGPPLNESFPAFYGFNQVQTDEAVAQYRVYFSQQGWQENVPYPGMETLLQDLKAAGKQLLIATSKPETFAVRILDHFGLSQYFDYICGPSLTDKSKATKAAVIRDALKRAGVTELDQVIMVGDRHHDVVGAQEVGLPAVGVLYGYGDRPELSAAGAAYIVKDMAELRNLLLDQ